jgi:hypothetical protein
MAATSIAIKIILDEPLRRLAVPLTLNKNA